MRGGRVVWSEVRISAFLRLDSSAARKKSENKKAAGEGKTGRR